MTIINVCNLFAPIDWNNKYSYSYSYSLVTCDRLEVFSNTTVSSTNKTDRLDIIEILLKVALNTN